MKGLKGLQAAPTQSLSSSPLWGGRSVVHVGMGTESLNRCLPPGLCESLDGYSFYETNSILKVCQNPSLVF